MGTCAKSSMLWLCTFLYISILREKVNRTKQITLGLLLCICIFDHHRIRSGWIGRAEVLPPCVCRRQHKRVGSMRVEMCKTYQYTQCACAYVLGMFFVHFCVVSFSKEEWVNTVEKWSTCYNSLLLKPMDNKGVKNCEQNINKRKERKQKSDGLFNTAHNNTGVRNNEGECGEQNGEGKVKGV